MDREKNKGGEKNMPTMKPIQATPELSGEDAMKLIRDVNRKPTKEAEEWNKMLCKVLDPIIKK